MMDKAIVFGVGNQFKKYQNLLNDKFNIVAYVDNFVEEIDDVRVFRLSEALYLDFDKIIITTLHWSEMLKQCLDSGIKKEKIIILDLIPELSQKTVGGVRAFGQYYEDLIVLGIFGQIGITHPSYLDAGCNHPYKMSNTALMYLSGSNGVNIDANRVSIDAFNHVRTKNTVNLNCGIAPDGGIRSFYIHSEDSGLNTFSFEEIEYSKVRFNAEFNKIEQVECMPLSNIIEEYCDGVFPDYFDCDIEGLDYDVIKSYDMSLNGPKVACVEVRPDKMEQFDNLFCGYDYFVFCRIGGNTIYVRNEYKKRLKLYKKDDS